MSVEPRQTQGSLQRDIVLQALQREGQRDPGPHPSPGKVTSFSATICPNSHEQGVTMKVWVLQETLHGSAHKFISRSPDLKLPKNCYSALRMAKGIREANPGKVCKHGARTKDHQKQAISLTHQHKDLSWSQKFTKSSQDPNEEQKGEHEQGSQDPEWCVHPL